MATSLSQYPRPLSSGLCADSLYTRSDSCSASSMIRGVRRLQTKAPTSAALGLRAHLSLTVGASAHRYAGVPPCDVPAMLRPPRRQPAPARDSGSVPRLSMPPVGRPRVSRSAIAELRQCIHWCFRRAWLPAALATATGTKSTRARAGFRLRPVSMACRLARLVAVLDAQDGPWLLRQGAPRYARRVPVSLVPAPPARPLGRRQPVAGHDQRVSVDRHSLLSPPSL